MEIKAADVKALRDKSGAGFMDCKNALKEANGDAAEAEKILKKKGMAKAEKKSGREAGEGAVGFVIADNQKEAAMVEVKCETDFVARSDAFQSFLKACAEGVLGKQSQVSADALSGIQVDGKPLDDARHAAVLNLGENIQVSRGQYLATDDGVIYGYSHGNKIAVLVVLEKQNEQLGKDIAMHIAALAPAAITENDIPAEIMNEEKSIYEAQLKDDKKPEEIKNKIITGKLKKFASGMCLYGQPFVKEPKETIAEILKKESNGVKGFIRFALGEGV